ncbi:MAG TPA: DUF4242 domain-containing protein [Bacteroidales bacterium]|nr:DUF4242 domain-containing protein [Bacteroidales bacterium]
MKKVAIQIFMGVTIMMVCSMGAFSQDMATRDKVVLKRFLVERSFPNGLNIPVNEEGSKMCLTVVSNNAEDNVTWIHSYVTKDKKKTYCIYDAPSEEAIRKSAKANGLPVDNIIEVRVLDPYFYN